MLRIFKVEIFIKKTSDGDETNVSQLIYNTVTDLLLKLLITAAVFMVIENQDCDPLNNNNGNPFL